MKKRLFLLTSLSLIAALSISLMLTSCSKEKEDIEDIGGEGLILSLDLASDSDNGVEWSFEQTESLFSCEKSFLEEEDEDGEVSAEVQTFTLRPIKSGKTSIRFINASNNTTYTYECQVDETLDNVTIDSSKGESGGKEVDAPEIVMERN